MRPTNEWRVPNNVGKLAISERQAPVIGFLDEIEFWIEIIAQFRTLDVFPEPSNIESNIRLESLYVNPFDPTQYFTLVERDG